jgi:hypothetical protein
MRKITADQIRQIQVCFVLAVICFLLAELVHQQLLPR